jgi:predicted DNA-binding ribbon-helix-helix protein
MIEPMRTTIDIPDDDHARLTALARERGVTLGALLVELADRGLRTTAPLPGGLRLSPLTGLLTVSTGVPITHEEVKAFLEDDGLV